MQKFLLFSILFTLISGCNSQSLPVSTNIPTSSLIIKSTIVPPTITPTPKTELGVEATSSPISKPSPTPSPAISLKPLHTDKEISKINDNQITLGEYAVANESPIDLGDAVITSIGKDLYHLKVNVARGLNHHEGYIESDFNVNSGKVTLTEKEYANINIVFTLNKMIINYPVSEHHGGMNAEPRGEYYLKKTDSEDNLFMKNLFDFIKLGVQYRNGFTDVYVTSVKDRKQLMLLQSQSSINRQLIVSENVVVYNEDNGDFQYIGEISSYEMKKLTDKLTNLGFKQDDIYKTLRKTSRDRYFQVQMNHYDSKGNNGLEDLLTDQEAFFIVTGEEGKTSISSNQRNKDNIGAIFISDVDHSDSQSVTIHIYEVVRNDEEDIHTATSDWITVDRSTGKIKGFYEDN